MKTAKNIAKLFVDTYRKWMEDRAMRMAAALSYYLLFSLAPLLFILSGILGALAERFLFQIGIDDEISHLLNNIFGPELAEFVLNLSESSGESTALTSSLPLISIIGLIITFWGASNVFNYLHEALNTIWGVQPIATGSILLEIRRRLLAFLVVFIAGALLVLYLLANTLLALLLPIVHSLVPEALELLPDFQVLQFSQSLLLFVVTTLLFAAFYRILPDVEIGWRDVFVGAVFTSLLFGIGVLVLNIYFRFYTASFAGAAGSLVVLLLWFYYSSQIFMFGAEFTYMYAKRYGSKITPANYTMAVNKTLVEFEDSEIGEPGQAPDGTPANQSSAGDAARNEQATDSAADDPAGEPFVS